MSAQKFDRILVAIADPAEGVNKAIRRASALARMKRAPVSNCSMPYRPPCLPEWRTPQRSNLPVTRRRKTGDCSSAWRIVCGAKNSSSTQTVQTGFPVHEAILRQVRISKADLLVIEARKHNVFARLLLTQTDFELIRRCPVPLLIVKGRAAWRSPRILAALDPFHSHDKPSALDGEIVAAAGAVAGLVRGSVHAAHIYLPLGSYVADPPMAPAALAGIPAQEKAIDSV